MKLTAAAARVLHGFQQYGVAIETAFFNHQVDLGDVHVNDAPRADVQVPDFAVAHLPLRQADEASAGVDESVGILGEQAVIIWFAGESNGVGFGGRRITPAIKNDKDKRTVHRRERILNDRVIGRSGDRVIGKSKIYHGGTATRRRAWQRSGDRIAEIAEIARNRRNRAESPKSEKNAIAENVPVQVIA